MRQDKMNILLFLFLDKGLIQCNQSYLLVKLIEWKDFESYLIISLSKRLLILIYI